MKITIYVLVTISCLFNSGCQKKDIWYNAVFDNTTEYYLHSGKVTGWSGVLAPGGNYIGLTIPVPDEIEVTWQSAIKGKEKEAQEHLNQIEQLLDKYLTEKWDNGKEVSMPQYDSFPPTLFETHKVVLVLKGKVPKRPKNGEIVVTYTGDENFDVHYIEKQNDND